MKPLKKIEEILEGPFIKFWLDKMESDLMLRFPDSPERFFIKEEQMVNFARIMLIIYYYAREEESIDETERLTNKHIVALKRATIYLLNRIQNLETDTSSWITIETIDQDTIYLSRIVDIFRKIRDNIVYDGFKRTDEDKDKLLYEKVHLQIPDLTKRQFRHIVDLGNFLDLVQRSPNYEKRYLRFVYKIYNENVSTDIKKELGLVFIE